MMVTGNTVQISTLFPNISTVASLGKNNQIEYFSFHAAFLQYKTITCEHDYNHTVELPTAVIVCTYYCEGRRGV